MDLVGGGVLHLLVICCVFFFKGVKGNHISFSYFQSTVVVFSNYKMQKTYFGNCPRNRVVSASIKTTVRPNHMNV